jgi:putative phosphoesterase
VAKRLHVLVLADTHIRPGRARRLPDAVYDELGRVDVVLHAGDVVTGDLLAELSGFAPVHAVLGNNDAALVGVLPETLEVELGGLHIAMVHDTGPSKGREARVHRRFPDAGLVVYGHSHLPTDIEGVNGQRLFNPGSPTERRNAPYRSYGLLTIGAGSLVRHDIVPVSAQHPGHAHR